MKTFIIFLLSCVSALAADTGIQVVSTVTTNGTETTNAVSTNIEPPLISAVLNGQKDLVESLLAENADVNVRNRNRWTPLHCAALKNRSDLAALLIAHGANIDATNNPGATPLDVAANIGSEDVAKLLIAHKANIRGKDVRTGWTPLHGAAFHGHISMVKLLLANGADINAKDNDGMTPLYWAGVGHHKEMVELLLANHADMNIKDKDGNTPLSYAVLHEKEGIADLLRQHGAWNQPNQDTNLYRRASLFPSDAASTNPIPQFAFGSITNLESFYQKLRQPAESDRLSRYLTNRFSPDLLGIMEMFPQLGGAKYGIRILLTSNLNEIIQGKSLYQTGLFTNVGLSEGIKALVVQNPQGTNLIRLNYLLLLAAYPNELSTVPLPFELPEPILYYKDDAAKLLETIKETTSPEELQRWATTIIQTYKGSTDSVFIEHAPAFVRQIDLQRGSPNGGAYIPAKGNEPAYVSVYWVGGFATGLSLMISDKELHPSDTNRFFYLKWTPFIYVSASNGT